MTEKRTIQIETKLEDGVTAKADKIRRSLEDIGKGLRSGLSSFAKPITIPFQALDGFLNRLLSIRNVVAGLAIVRGVQAIGNAVGDLVEGTRKVGEFASATQSTTESVGALEFGLQGLGVKLEQVRPGFVAFAKNLEAARNGASAQRIEFDKLGIQVGDFKDGQIDLLAVLERVADAYVRQESATKRVAAATTVFGDAGALLAPLLEKGSEGIRKLEADARRAGVVFSSEQIAGVEKLGRQYAALASSMSAAFRGLVVEVAPDVTRALESITTWIQEHRPEITAFLVGSVDIGIRGFGFLASVATETFGVILRGLNEVGAAAQRIPFLRSQERDTLEKQIENLRTSIEGIEKGNGAPGAVPSILQDQAALVAALRTQLQSLEAERDKLNKDGPLAGVIAQTDTAREKIDALFASMHEGFRKAVDDAKQANAIAVPQAPPSAPSTPNAPAQRIGFDDQQRIIATRIAIQSLKPATEEAQVALVSLRSEAAALNLREQFEAGKLALSDYVEQLHETQDSARRAGDAVRSAFEAQAIQVNREILSLGDSTAETRARLAELDGQARRLELQRAFEEGRISADQLERSIEAVDQATAKAAARARGDLFQGISDGVRSSIAAFADLTKVGEEGATKTLGAAFGGITDSIRAGIFQTESFGAVWRRVGKEILATLAEMAVKFAAIQAVKGLGLALPFATGGYMLGEVQSRHALRRMAFGGIARGPTLTIHGEGRDAEAAVPLPDGRSIPVQFVGRGGAGGGLTVIVQAIDGKDAARFFLENRGLLAAIQRDALATSNAMRSSVQGALR